MGCERLPTYATEVTHDVQALPQKLVLSGQPAIAPSSEIIILASAGARAFDVTGVTVDPEGALSVAAIEHYENDNHQRFRVTLGKPRPNTINSQLIFQISHPENGLTYDLRVTVAAIGDMIKPANHIE